MRLTLGSRIVRSSPMMAVAVLAVASGCYNRDDYLASPERLDRALKLSTADADAAIPADGFSRLTIDADIDREAAGERRIVRFTTTGGTLAGGTVVSGSNEVTADASGRASVDLMSDLTARTVRVRAEIKADANFARTIDIQMTSVIADSVIRFIAVPATVAADGATAATVAVQLAARLPNERLAVVFTAASGIVGGTSTVPTLTTTADAGTHRAAIELRAPTTAQRTRITAAAAGFQRDTFVDFVRALPDTIVLTPDTAQLVPGQSTVIRARLIRAFGKVSPETFAFFDARDANGAQVGLIRDVQPSDAAGIATARFVATGFTRLTTVTIRVVVEGAAKAGAATIVVTAPPAPPPSAPTSSPSAPR